MGRVHEDAPEGAGATLFVLVERDVVAEAALEGSARPRYRDVAFSRSEWVPEGALELRVLIVPEDPRRGARVLIDHLDVLSGCRNAPPGPPIVAGADGFGDGRWGWQGLGYFFRALPSRDPDGDRVLYYWDWGDGTVTPGGLTAGHSFSEPGVARVTLVARDDPAGREGCELTNSKTARSEPFGFTVLREWRASLVAPTPGESCVAGRAVGSAAVQAVAAQCHVAATVDTIGAPATLVAKATFLLDGEAFAEDASAPYTAAYDSRRASAGYRVLQACFEAVGDKYVRALCTERYRFVNVGAGE